MPLPRFEQCLCPRRNLTWFCKTAEVGGAETAARLVLIAAVPIPFHRHFGRIYDVTSGASTMSAVERFMAAMSPSGCLCVVLNARATPEDMLKAYFQCVVFWEKVRFGFDSCRP